MNGEKRERRNLGRKEEARTKGLLPPVALNRRRVRNRNRTET